MQTPFFHSLTNMHLVTSLILILVCIWSLWSFLWKNFFSTKIKGPWAFPLLGTVSVFIGGLENITTNCMCVFDKYRPYCKVWMANKMVIVLTNPNDVQLILKKSLEKDELYRYTKIAFGDGLISEPVQNWRSHRKTIAVTFKQKKLDRAIDIYTMYSKELVEKLKITDSKEKYIDIFPLMSQCTLDVICTFITGTQINALKEESNFFMWMTRLFEVAAIRIVPMYLCPDFLWKFTSFHKESMELDKKVQNYIKTVIRNKRLENHKTDSDDEDFLEHLLKEETWSEEDLTNETRTVIAAASDATAFTLSCCLMMLGMHQDIQKQIYEEICTVIGDNNRDVTKNDLRNLQYLDRVIKETMRVFPVAGIIGRELTEDTVLGKHCLPRGTSIGIPILFIHRDPENYPDPLKFDPDRFLSENVAKQHPCTFIPFGFGPRNCIGARLAMMSMKVILTTLLRNFRVVETPYKSIADVKIKFDIATNCVNGYRIRLEPYNH